MQISSFKRCRIRYINPIANIWYASHNSPTICLQPNLCQQIPALPEILASVTPHTHDGLLGICLSGAGPTILALATHNFEAIGQEVEQRWKELGNVDCTWKILEIGPGATLETLC